MKKVFVMMLMIFLSCDKNPASEIVPQSENDINFEILSEYLELSDTQINEYTEKFQERRAKNTEKEGRRHRSKRDGFQKEMFESLNASQQGKMKELIEAKMAGNVPQEYTRIRNEKISVRLDLTSEQSAKFAAEQSKIDLKMKELHQSDLDKREKFDSMRALKDESKSVFQSFMTEDQLSKLAEINRPRKMRSQKGHYRKDNSLKKMTEKLNLSDDQAAQVKVIFESMKESAKAIKDSDSSKEDKKSAMESLLDEKMSKVKLLLTEEQAANFVEMKNNRKRKQRR